MPYFISDTAEGCPGWATVKDDGEVSRMLLIRVWLLPRLRVRRLRVNGLMLNGVKWICRHRLTCVLVLSGDGVVDRTIREARAMAEGNVTADKWVRLRAWIARHLVDMDAPQNTPGDENYPGPGAVAMALWGGGGSKRSGGW